MSPSVSPTTPILLLDSLSLDPPFEDSEFKVGNQEGDVGDVIKRFKPNVLPQVTSIRDKGQAELVFVAHRGDFRSWSLRLRALMSKT